MALSTSRIAERAVDFIKSDPQQLYGTSVIKPANSPELYNLIYYVAAALVEEIQTYGELSPISVRDGDGIKIGETYPVTGVIG